MKTVLYTPGRLHSEVVFDRLSENGKLRNTVLGNPSFTHAQTTTHFFDLLNHAIDLLIRVEVLSNESVEPELYRAFEAVLRGLADWVDACNLSCWALEPGQYDYKRMGKHEVWKDIFLGSGRASKAFARVSHLVNRLKHHGGYILPITVNAGSARSAHYHLVIMNGEELVPDRKGGTTQHETGVISHELKEILYLVHYFGGRLGDRLAAYYGVAKDRDPAVLSRIDEKNAAVFMEIADLFFVPNRNVYGNVCYSFNQSNTEIMLERRDLGNLDVQTMSYKIKFKILKKGLKVQLPFAGEPRKFSV